VELLADHFVNYIFDTYQGTRHVRRVATWIGFLLKASRIYRDPNFNKAGSARSDSITQTVDLRLAITTRLVRVEEARLSKYYRVVVNRKVK
jgi:hypothetical protein